MNVKKLIEILTKEVKEEDMENAAIELWFEDQEYEITSMSGFGLSPDIIIHLKEIISPVIKPAIFKKEHLDVINQKKKEIFESSTDGEWEDEDIKSDRALLEKAVEFIKDSIDNGAIKYSGELQRANVILTRAKEINNVT